MKDLIKALTIFEKYNKSASTHCEHDTLYICGVEPEDVSEKDIELLDKYGFFVSDESGELCFMSFNWGSC